jgi:hypothetical protein
MASVGHVRIGSRNIDIQAFTGEVTSRSDRFLLSNRNGQHAIDVSERVISLSRGHTVTGFWGIVRGTDSDWLALFNHDTGQWGWCTPTRNELAGPPMNQALLVVAAVATVLSVVSLLGAFGPPRPATGVWLMLSVLVFRLVQRRRKALMTAVSAALAAVRMEA